MENFKFDQKTFEDLKSKSREMADTVSFATMVYSFVCRLNLRMSIFRATNKRPGSPEKKYKLFCMATDRESIAAVVLTMLIYMFIYMGQLLVISVCVNLLIIVIMKCIIKIVSYEMDYQNS